MNVLPLYPEIKKQTKSPQFDRISVFGVKEKELYI